MRNLGLSRPFSLVRWRLSSHLPLVRQLSVASPVVVCLRLASPFVTQPPNASILDPSSCLRHQRQVGHGIRYARCARPRVNPFLTCLGRYLVNGSNRFVRRLRVNADVTLVRSNFFHVLHFWEVVMCVVECNKVLISLPGD